MNIISAQYTEQGGIEVVTDSQTISVPNSKGNRHYQMVKEWEADGNTIAAYVAPAKEPRITGTAREFMDLFTPTEKLAIVNLSMSNAEIKLWYDEALAGDVWLGHANVAAGLLDMQGAGVITSERAAEIMATDFDA